MRDSSPSSPFSPSSSSPSSSGEPWSSAWRGAFHAESARALCLSPLPPSERKSEKEAIDSTRTVCGCSCKKIYAGARSPAGPAKKMNVKPAWIFLLLIACCCTVADDEVSSMPEGSSETEVCAHSWHIARPTSIPLPTLLASHCCNLKP